MTPVAVSLLALLLAYLIGAIPFAYVVVYAVKRVDIRTVGSGNVGATNAGRVLGSKYFFLVFLLDFCKGLLPTLFFPRGVVALAGTSPPWLPVMVAMATILGHNFPVYLRFRGGKGAATSLGAMFGLDWSASLTSAIAFLVFLLITKIVSLSSVCAATVFVLVHFSTTPRPFSPANEATSLVILVLWGMLIVRHRKNFVRIGKGTEPKVQLRKHKEAPKGKVRSAVVGLLAMSAFAAGVYGWWIRPKSLDCGLFVLEPVSRVSTGHQRAERLAFADEGRLLAVTCPRYNRVVLYRVEESRDMTVVRDVDVQGRAVAVWPMKDRFLVLVRPCGDDRHVEAGWLQAIDFAGKPLGAKLRVGFDPDDLAVEDDGRWAFVLLSGNAEGETNRPNPELVSIDLAHEDGPKIVGRLTLSRPGDDPDRIQLSASGRKGAVSLLGTNQVAAIDLESPARPRLVARKAMPALDVPYPSLSDDDWIMMPSTPGREAVLFTLRGKPGPEDQLKGSYLVSTLPENSGLEVIDAPRRKPLGRLPLRGAGNLGTIRPMGIAYSPERELIAVANRSGGSVHLVEVRPKNAASTTGADVASRDRAEIAR